MYTLAGTVSTVVIYFIAKVHVCNLHYYILLLYKTGKNQLVSRYWEVVCQVVNCFMPCHECVYFCLELYTRKHAQTLTHTVLPALLDRLIGWYSGLIVYNRMYRATFLLDGSVLVTIVLF